MILFSLASIFLSVLPTSLGWELPKCAAPCVQNWFCTSKGKNCENEDWKCACAYAEFSEFYLRCLDDECDEEGLEIVGARLNDSCVSDDTPWPSLMPRSHTPSPILMLVPTGTRSSPVGEVKEDGGRVTTGGGAIASGEQPTRDDGPSSFSEAIVTTNKGQTNDDPMTTSTLPILTALLPDETTSTSVPPTLPTVTKSQPGESTFTAPPGAVDWDDGGNDADRYLPLALGIGLGVGLPLTVAIVGVVVFLFWKAERRGKISEHPTPTYEEVKVGLEGGKPPTIAEMDGTDRWHEVPGSTPIGQGIQPDSRNGAFGCP